MNLDNFHIYRDGEYDRQANIKMKLNEKKLQLKSSAIDMLWKINDSFERK
jgi:hypothetical protein